MKFLIIDARRKLARIDDFRDLVHAETSVGLDPKCVDHGSIRRGVGYVVHDFSLFVPADKQDYFRIGSRLIAGHAVLYAYDKTGETIDFEIELGFDAMWAFGIQFFESAARVEEAIASKLVLRPMISINGDPIWRWPNPPPSDIAEEILKRGVPK